MRTSGRKRPLSGTQHNFHDTKRETLKRARPQVVTSRDNRLTDTSRGKGQVLDEWGTQLCQYKELAQKTMYNKAPERTDYSMRNKIDSNFSM